MTGVGFTDRRCRPAVACMLAITRGDSRGDNHVTGLVGIDRRRIGGVHVGVRRAPRIRERDHASVAAGVVDQLAELVSRNRALVDRDVCDLVLGVDVDADDVRIPAEPLLDTLDAAHAGERAALDGERHEAGAIGIVRGRGRGRYSPVVAVLLSVVR
jgi:hypothetical protein